MFGLYLLKKHIAGLSFICLLFAISAEALESGPTPTGPATDCLNSVVSTTFSSGAGSTWLSPFSGYVMLLPGQIGGNSQYMTLAVYYRSSCAPSNLSVDLSKVPAGITLSLHQAFYNSYMQHDPTLLVSYVVYFVSADSSIAEGNLNFNIPVYEGLVNKATVAATLKIDKTPPQPLAASEIRLQCIQSNTLGEVIRVEFAPAPVQPSGQAPIRRMYGYDSNDNKISYTLYSIDNTTINTVAIEPKDYGKPIRFKRADIPNNTSEFSQEFIFSHATINSRWSKRLSKCVAK